MSVSNTFINNALIKQLHIRRIAGTTCPSYSPGTVFLPVEVGLL